MDNGVLTFQTWEAVWLLSLTDTSSITWRPVATGADTAVYFVV